MNVFMYECMCVCVYLCMYVCMYDFFLEIGDCYRSHRLNASPHYFPEVRSVHCDNGQREVCVCVCVRERERKREREKERKRKTEKRNREAEYVLV